MLTEDSRTTALAVPSALANDVQAPGQVVGIAGEVVNDEPALAQADISIAMGTGTDVAKESAGVTLVKGDLQGFARALRRRYDIQFGVGHQQRIAA